MKTFKKNLTLAFFLVIFLFSNILPVLAQGVKKPIVLDAYSIIKQNNNELNVVGLVEKEQKVMIYVNGKYKGFANISENNKNLNTFYFVGQTKKSKKPLNINVISQGQSSSALSAPVHVKDRKIKKEPKLSNSSIQKQSDIPQKISKEKNNIQDNSNQVSTLPAPTLISPKQNEIINNPKPFIIGLSKEDTRVHFYIDGEYNGKTPFLKSINNTANFAYKPFLNLDPGKHEILAIAENTQGKKSLLSKKITFTIENKIIAPVISTKEKTSFSKENGLELIGWAKDNSLVKIFIDNKLKKEIKTKNNNNDLINFSYNSEKPLTRGEHIVYAVALDENGKKSPWSNIINFKIYNPEIATSASIENQKVSTSGINMIVEENESNTKNGTSTEIKTKDLGTTKGASETSTKRENIINKVKDQKINFFILVLFLAAIITWMTLVNKELTKGKNNKKTEEKDSKKETKEDKKE